MPAPELIRAELTQAGASPDEAVRLAALLERAAEPARVDVPRAEVEHALERVRPASRRWAAARVPRLAVGAAAAFAAVLALALLGPRQQQDVEARALSALGGPDSVLHLKLDIFSRITGATGTTHRDVWYDAARGRARWTNRDDFGRVFSDTLVEPGRFERVLRATDTRIVGTSCRAFAAGCAELIDPVTRYRDALERTDTRFVPVSFEGRRAYRLLLPLQGRIDQVVFVDAQTLLPRSIRWRERQPDGDVSVAATIDLTDAQLVDRDDAKRALELPPGGRVVRVEPAGAKRGERPLTREQARARAPYWLGPSGLSGFRELRYARGDVTVARYGPTEVWTFGRAVPPELLASRFAETKTLDVNGRPATFFSDGLRLFVVLEGRPSVAVIVPQATKEDVIALAGRLERLR